MAIQWGSISKRIRLGIDVSMSPATVTKDTSSVTLTWKVYAQTTYAYSGTYGLARTGTGPTGTTTVSISTPNGQTTTVLLWQGTQSVSTSYTGPVTRTMTATFPASGTLFDGAKPTVTVSFTVPQRPPQLPSQATAASATYVSDTRADLAWTRPSNADNASAIWSNVVVQRQTEGSSTWATVATLAGTATSWSDMTIAADGRYRWRVAGKNASGTGTYRETSYVTTTPATPTGVSATKDSNGDIIVTWTDNSAHETGFQVYDNGTAGGNLVGSVGPNTTTFTHVSPSTATTHTYYVRATGNDGRNSAFSAASNTVTLLAPPNPPTLVAPVSTTVAVGNVTFQWVHNPVDTTPQTRFEVRYRTAGSTGSWTVIGLNLSAQSLTTAMPLGEWEWQARTKGAHASLSDWSPSATFTVGTPPTATISAPSGTITGPSTTIQWAFYHADGNPQTGWQAQVVLDGTPIAAASGTDDATSWTTPLVIPNSVTVTIRVRVRESSGLWSDWDEETRTVSYLPPAESAVDAYWVDGQGYAYITARAVSEDGYPETVTHNIERSTDGGETWTLIGEDLGTDVDFIDYEAPAGGTYHYRIAAVSASPSIYPTVVEVTVPEIPLNDVIWISGGPAFSKVYALAFSPDVKVETGRDRTLENFDGRRHPVEIAGTGVPYSITVSATLPAEQYEEGGELNGLAAARRAPLEALFAMPGPHLYRDPEGRVIYGSVSALQWSRDPGGKGTVSFTLTRVARPTAEVEAALAEYYTERTWIEL